MSDRWPDLAKVNWEDLYPRLLLAAHLRLRRMRWRGHPKDTPPGAPLPEDFVHQAVEKALGGARHFDPSRTLFENFLQIISSDISNLAYSYENKNVQRVDEESIVEIRDSKDSPEDEAIRRNETERLIIYVRGKDSVAASIAELVLSTGISSTHVIGAVLGRTAAQVEAAKKRLRRLISKYMQESNVSEGHKSSQWPRDKNES